MFVDKDYLRESVALTCWHRWPRPMAWWQYGILFSLGCSALCIGLLVFGR